MLSFQNFILSGNTEEILLKIAILIVSAFILKNIFNYFSNYFIAYVEQGVIRNLRDELYEHIHKLPMNFFKNEKTGNLISRFTNDVNIIQQSITAVFLNLFQDPITIIVFFVSPFFYQLEWNKSENIFIASYFTTKFGSIFPLFPYLQFAFFGAIWGIIISQNKDFITKKLNLFLILIVGSVVFYSSNFVNYLYYDSVLRVGVLLILLSIFGFIGAKIKSVPKVFASFSKNSLWIYIIHLVILYGSPTSIGLSQIIGNSLSAESTAIAVTLMLILMIFISLGIDKFRVRKFNYFRKNFRLE